MTIKKIALILALALCPLALIHLGGQTQLPYGSPRVKQMKLLLPSGVRPKFSPDGTKILYDRRNQDGLYDTYVSDTNGATLGSLSEGKPVGARHSGNPIYHPSGKLIAMIAQESGTHFLDAFTPYGQFPLGEPGIGLFNNLWFTDSVNYVRVTNIPLKQAVDDGIPAMAVVNPRFTLDGARIIWTERYSDGGNQNWGLWRLKVADLVQTTTPPYVNITNERVLFTPTNGTYVTAMDIISPGILLVSGNLDGQHEFGMDLYRFNVLTGTYTNLTNTPTFWEEGACIAPSGKIVYMTNEYSQFTLDTSKPWPGQPLQRDYKIMNADGSGKERLTYFNDPNAAEYTTWNSVAIVCDVSPDGKTIAGTVGRDVGTPEQAWLLWQIWRIDLHQPL